MIAAGTVVVDTGTVLQPYPWDGMTGGIVVVCVLIFLVISLESTRFYAFPLLVAFEVVTLL